MGHPSLKITKLIPNVGSKERESVNKACDACQRAKQTRDSFVLNSQRAITVFELIHCDL